MIKYPVFCPLIECTIHEGDVVLKANVGDK